MNENQTRWEALIAGVQPDRSAREILFDPMVEDWAFAGISEGYREELLQKKRNDQERALLLDRLRWVVQKRLAGRAQEAMLLFLAGLSQVQIAERLGTSRSTIRRTLLEAGERLQRTVQGTDLFRKGSEKGDLRIKIMPLDTEDDYFDFVQLVETSRVEHVALGTFADLREALVVFREAA